MFTKFSSEKRLGRHSLFSKVLFFLLALGLVASAGACATNSTQTEADEPSEPVRLTDMWVRAVDDGMTAAFGEIHNDTDTPVVVISVSSPSSDDVQLHETVDEDGKTPLMQEVQDGFAVRANSSFVLEPGGNHIMLMGVKKPLLAGEEVEFTLTFADGRTQTFTAPIKDFVGGAEDYESHGFDDHDNEHEGH